MKRKRKIIFDKEKSDYKSFRIPTAKPTQVFKDKKKYNRKREKSIPDF